MESAMRFLSDLLLRVIIIVTVTDSIIFYLLSQRHETPTLLFSVLVITITLVSLILSILYDFRRYHAWNMRL